MNNRTGKSISIFGTASDVGKSIVCTAICRILSDYGIQTAPFKAQNMSNNSCVTMEGGELARAQYVQAEAARVSPSIHMNPILLKPLDDRTSQVVLRGKPIGNRTAADYFSNTDSLYQEALQSLDRLRSSYDFLVVEGAGSCAEVNLRERDFVNFKIAHELDSPVILIADIDRGGVFAQVIGTLAVLPEEDRKRIKGIIINRFRGDPRLFDTGIQYLEEKTEIPVIGLIPYYYHINIDAEDSLPKHSIVDPPANKNSKDIQIGIFYFPHISNISDFSCLEIEGVLLHYLRKPRDLRDYHAVILPGSKNTREDLRWLKDSGWEEILKNYVNSGGTIVGLCGGYQMLGQSVKDTLGVEGVSGEERGLGFLNVKTNFQSEKILTQVRGHVLKTREEVYGYEIHHGVTEHIGQNIPFLSLQSIGKNSVTYVDGAVSADKRIWGTYVHGIFDSPYFRRRFLKDIGGALFNECNQYHSPYQFRQKQYDLLADHFREHLNILKLLEVSGLKKEKDQVKDYNGYKTKEI